MEQFLQETLNQIREPDREAMAQALARQESLAKPPHSLGKLEDISVKLAGMTGRIYNPVDRRRVLIFASDNGIVEEGVASCPQSVTLSQTINFTRGLTGVAVLAKHFNTELDVMDVGINADFHQSGVRDVKIAHGTQNFAKTHAMSREQADRALQIGIEAARRAAGDGIQIIGVGEMGIGNTSTSSAVLSALLGLPARQTVSRGAGINNDAYARKIALIDEAIARWQPDPADPVDVLMKVGGFDLAAMCGAFLGGTVARGNRRLHQRCGGALRLPAEPAGRGLHDPLPRLGGEGLSPGHGGHGPGADAADEHAAGRGQRLPHRLRAGGRVPECDPQHGHLRGSRYRRRLS